MGSCLHTGNDGRDLEDNFTRSCAEHCGGLAGSLDQGSGRRTDRRAPSLPENRSRSGIRTIRWHPQSASAVRSAQSAVAKGYSFCHSAANDVHLTAMWRCWSFFLLAIIIAYPEAVHAVNRNKRAREDGCLETVGASQRAVGSVQVDPATRLVTTRKSRLKSVQLLPPRVPTRRRSLVRNNTEGLVPRIASTDTGIRILSNYKRVADIGSGSFGRVHVASDLRNHGRLVAIKRQDTSTASRRMVAFNEFHLLQRLRGCACIVQIFKGLTTKCRLYLVMEYLSGGTLAHRIRSQDGISERDAKRYLHDIVCGVDACHSRDIILNDIKPDNMAFDGEGNLKLIDFGVAEYSPHRKMSKSMTTANYVSPEQFELVDQRVQMKEFDGAAADVWAVGATLIEMLTGHCLFLGRGDEDVIRNVLNLHINVRCLAGYRHLSQGARLLVERMLEQDPKMRPTIREIALDEWLQPESNANA